MNETLFAGIVLIVVGAGPGYLIAWAMCTQRQHDDFFLKGKAEQYSNPVAYLRGFGFGMLAFALFMTLIGLLLALSLIPESYIGWGIGISTAVFLVHVIMLSIRYRR